MVSSHPNNRLFLYPDPVRAKDVPYKNERKENPAMRGWVLYFMAFLMESFGWFRYLIWKNAGFASLRNIFEDIKHHEPWFDPEVYPLKDSESSETDDIDKAGLEIPSELPQDISTIRSKNSVAHYRSLYLSGDMTPLDVVHAILPFIRKDVAPPGEHSVNWFHLNLDQVLKDAEASTLRYKGKRSLGLLDGIPIAVKDEYDMEGYITTLGSVNDYTGGRSLYEGKIDAWIIKKLKEAGAIILGKVSMHEFGMDTSGNNITYGTPRNPYNPQYYTGGSSSGCAYAVANGLVPIALGSDGGGSIRIPSAFCSVTGLKPTHGRLSFYPNQNHSKGCGVNGPIASDIYSLAAVYNVISQPDPTSYFPYSPITTAKLLGNTNRSKTIGVPEQWFRRSTPAIQRLCNDMMNRLVKEKGYTIIPIPIPYLVEGQVAHSLTILTDAVTLLPETKNLSPANRILIELGRVTPSSDYLLANKLRRVMMQHLAWLWQTYPGMVIVTPVSSCAGWPIRSKSELKHGISDGDTTLKTMEYVWLANFCGTPSISVPAGYVIPEGQSGAGEVASSDTVGKVPVGLMATGEWTNELELMQFGLDAEEMAAEFHCQPPGWVDVIGLAKDGRRHN